MKVYFDVAKHIFCNSFGFVPLPSFCTFIITWRCNFRCSMCSIWKRKIDEEMSIEELAVVVSKLKFIKYLKITGGEPFLHPNIINLVKVIIKEINPFVLHITTNGFFTEEVEDFLKQFGASFLHLKVSIDGPEKVHDEIRGVSGSFNKAIKTLEKASLLKEKKFHLGVNYTVNEKNFDIEHLIEIRNLCTKLNVEFYVDFAYEFPPLYNTQSKKLNTDPYAYFETNIEKLRLFLEYFIKHINSGILVEKLKQKYYLCGFKNRVIRKVYKPNPKCVELRSHFRLLPNGDITICLYKPAVVGNLLNSSFREIWFGKRMEKGRQEVKKCPGCWAGCEIGPNAIFTGDLFKALWY